MISQLYMSFGLVTRDDSSSRASATSFRSSCVNGRAVIVVREINKPCGV